jgi:hypothetical protein
MRNLKLIWDFKGPEAEQTARHHLIHLKEYIKNEDLDPITTGIEQVTGSHHLCFIAIDEKQMPVLRDALKPHRGQLWNG